MKKIVGLLCLSLMIAGSVNAKNFKQEIKFKGSQENKKSIKKPKKEKLYPIVTINLSCGSFTTTPWSPLGQVIIDMGNCCPSSLNTLLSDLNCDLCNAGCPVQSSYT